MLPYSQKIKQKDNRCVAGMNANCMTQGRKQLSSTEWASSSVRQSSSSKNAEIKIFVKTCWMKPSHLILSPVTPLRMPKSKSRTKRASLLTNSISYFQATARWWTHSIKPQHLERLHPATGALLLYGIIEPSLCLPRSTTVIKWSATSAIIGSIKKRCQEEMCSYPTSSQRRKR